MRGRYGTGIDARASGHPASPPIDPSPSRTGSMTSSSTTPLTSDKLLLRPLARRAGWRQVSYLVDGPCSLIRLAQSLRFIRHCGVATLAYRYPVGAPENQNMTREC